MTFKNKFGGRYWTDCLSVVLIVCILRSTAIPCPYELPTAVISINGQDLFVELALTPETRSCGLSNRFSLEKNRGMLFLFPDAGPRTFWMKDTHIPLAIAFIDDAGCIVQIHRMDADQTGTTYHSYQPVRYALEVNQDWFMLNGINTGDRVEMSLPPILNIQ